jgi:hypothetical protein
VVSDGATKPGPPPNALQYGVSSRFGISCQTIGRLAAKLDKERGATMTEQEWLTCTDPKPMLEFLRGKASDRKLRLFGVACCRSVWHWLFLPGRRAVEVAERYADELANGQELSEACNGAFEVAEAWLSTEGVLGEHTVSGHAAGAAVNVAYPESDIAASGSAECVAEALALRGDAVSHLAPHALVCDIFGNPFHRINLDPSLLSRNLVQLAQAIYDDRAFDRMPELADALQEAGCDNDEILGHCRGPGPHVRGCWVVDLVLGKQ